MIKMINTKFICLMMLTMILALGIPLLAQVQTEVPPVVAGAKPVTSEHIKVHGTALERNLEGDAVERDVLVFLPPSYAREKSRRYPVVYALHGYSMGGYGATRIGMKHDDVFGSLYIMSPCCLSPRQAGPPNPEIDKALQAVKTAEDAAKLPFFARAQLASAAAWSPNPNNPPLYLDLPTKAGESQPGVLAKWAANAPLAFIDQYIAGLRRYRAISMDVGDKDGLRVD